MSDKQDTNLNQRLNMLKRTQKEILKIMRTKKFALQVLDMVEQVAGHHFFSLYYLGGAKTVKEWAELAEDDPAQRTSQTTVRVCHDFEYAIAKVLQDNYNYKIIPKTVDVAGINGRYDVAVRKKRGRVVLAFEVKTTQSTNGWTGSTHSHNAGKVPFYVLIQYALNTDIKLGSGSLYGFFKSCHFSVTSPLKDGSAIIEWKGQATSSNSRTTGKVRIANATSYKPMICLGSVNTERARVWAKCVQHDLKSERTAKTNRLWSNGIKK